MRKLLLSMMAVLLFCGQLLAQTRTITGKVTDAQGQPISNASVVVKGTNTGTTTNADGTFSLPVGTGARTLVISSVGMASEEATLGTSDEVNVSLAIATSNMEEVVVVAYGAQQKRAITGSVTSVTAENIGRQQVTSPTQALQGLATGVLVINSTGQPGDNPTIRVRGIGSINANASPLIVVDGIPFDGNLSNFNPNDIESMNVLKDATATALYGSRAANGVILITTKTGRKGRDPEINFYSSYGVSSRAVNEYPFVSSEEYMKLAWEARRNQAQTAGIANPEQYATDNLINGFLRYNPYNVAKPVDATGNIVPDAQLLWNTDWTKEIQNSSIERKNIGVNVLGGVEKFRYFFSGDYLDQDGYIIKSNFKRISARFNADADLRSWLTVGVKSSVSSSKQNYPDQSGSAFRNAVQYGRIMSSIYPLYMRDDAGNLLLDGKGQPQYDFGFAQAGRTTNISRPVAGGTNAVAIQNLDEVLNDRQLTTLNTYAEIRLTKNLKFRSNFGIDRYVFTASNYQNPLYGDAAGVSGRVTKQRSLTTSYTWNNMLNYTQSFGDHNIGAMASTEAYDYTFEFLSAGKTGFPAPGLDELGPGSTLESINSYTDQNRLASYLGRLTYNYDQKYFVEGTVRRDGSSRFLPTARWGTFYAVGASWVMSEENFLKDVSFLDFLKLRASYGEVGNQSLTSYFPYLSGYSTGFNDLTNPGVLLNLLGNEAITWEKLGTYNIGIDFALWRNKLSGSVEYYNKNTFDLLFRRPLSGSTGFTGVDENIGTMINRGIEVTLNSKNITTKNFRWETNLNFATLKNELTKLPQEFIQDGSFRLEVGKSYLSYFIYEWAGVNPDNGLPQWYQDELDGSGNPTGKKNVVNGIATASRYYFGSALPKVTGGFSNYFVFRDFDLSFLINFALGGKVLDSDYIGLMHGFSNVGTQLHKDILNRWQKPGDITDVPRLRVGQNDFGSASTRHLFSGDYARLRNVTLGYTMPTTVLANVNAIKSLRFFIQADNFLTWAAGKEGMDPELNITGQTGQRSSSFKTLSAGLNVGF